MSDANNLISHLIELRSRILKALLRYLSSSFVLRRLRKTYKLLAMPLLEALPENASMITDVASPFLLRLNLHSVSFFIAIPYVLYQVWGLWLRVCTK